MVWMVHLARYLPNSVSTTLPFPTQQILDSSKLELKEFADDNFKFNLNIFYPTEIQYT